MSLIEAKRIIKKHYQLNRPVTNTEVVMEINNLKRRGVTDLDDNQQKLAAALNIFH